MKGCRECPRCGQLSLEHLETHRHCWECSYFPEVESGLHIWRDLEFRNIARRRNEEAQFLRRHSARLNDDQIDDYYKESQGLGKGIL